MASHSMQTPQRQPLSGDQSLSDEGSSASVTQPNASIHSADNPHTAAPAMAEPERPPRRANSTSEPKRCWVCQGDATEDTPNTSSWRSPCPCSLQAHESCLLEWFDSAQAPKPGQFAIQKKIDCPVCKAEIHIDRPQHFLVNMAERVSRTARLVALPAGVGVLSGVIYSGLMIYGFNTVHMVFGDRAATTLISPHKDWNRLMSRRGFKIYTRVLRSVLPFFPGQGVLDPRLTLGLPLIAPVLIASRTMLGDYVCAIMPVVYFMWPFSALSKNTRPHRFRPTPGEMFFTIIPAVRYLYNTFYSHVFAPFEKEWDLAVQRQPREGETAEQIAGNNIGNAGFDLDLEVQILGDALEEDEEVNAQNPDPEAQEILPLNRMLDAVQEHRGEHENGPQPEEPQIQLVAEQANLPNDGEPQVQAQLEGPPDQAQAPVAPEVNRWEIRRDISTASVASTVMGALFFPTISSLIGSLLHTLLPLTTTALDPPASGVSASHGVLSSMINFLVPGLKSGVEQAVQKGKASRMMENRWGGWLLRERWGRTVVGGCIFVVLKDAVVLYCKWRRAKDWGRRKVRDYVGGESVGTAA